MSAIQQTRGAASTAPRHYEAIIIGAGFAGIRALHELRELGLSVKVFEAGSDVGGTWYWNRYPGARTDTESWAYCFSFCPEIGQEWNWNERMPTWDQVCAYLRYVVDRLDMRRHFQFNTYIKSAVYDVRTNHWVLSTEAGETYTCTFFIGATGVLSVPCDPPFKGLETFHGRWFLSGRWPKQPVDFTGKRVGLIGTGATGVQILPVVAQIAGQVTVFQRTPNYVMPGRNHPLDDATRQGIKANYPALWEMTRHQAFGFPIPPANRLFDDYAADEQQRIFDGAWETGGFRFIFESFDDIITNERANAAAAEYVRNKIRTIVKDRQTAELLCPNYAFGAKRPPVGNFYFEAYNRPNVRLVDVNANPIREITPRGVLAGAEEHEFDILIFAIGFDAGTGALTQLEVRGEDGRTLKDKWTAGPRTQLGMMVESCPNMFMLPGPQTPFANAPVVINACTEWIGQAIRQVRAGGYRAIVATPAAVEAWNRHIGELLALTVLDAGAERVRTWYMGTNVPGKSRIVLFYFGGAAAYFKELQQSIDEGFKGFAFLKDGSTAGRVGQEAAAIRT